MLFVIFSDFFNTQTFVIWKKMKTVQKNEKSVAYCPLLAQKTQNQLTNVLIFSITGMGTALVVLMPVKAQ